MPVAVAGSRGKNLTLLAVALVGWALAAWRYDFLVDDAFISFRYAKHLAGGLGLTFNAGDPAPVEGFTNLGWVLTLSLFEALGMNVALVSRVLSALAALAVLVLFWRRARRYLAPLDAALATLALGVFPSFACWTTGGLETMVFGLAVFGVFERLVLADKAPRAVQAGLFAALAVLTRADGLVWVGSVYAAAALTLARNRRAILVRSAAIPLAAAALLLAWRWQQYQAWLPNTARVKLHLGAASLERGALYALSWLAHAPAAGLILLLSVWSRGTKGPARAAMAVCAMGLGYAVLVGGDWMPWFRLLVPLLPILFLWTCLVLARMRADVRRPILAALVASSCLTAFDVELVPRAWREKTKFRWSDAAYLSENECWVRGKKQISTWTTLGRALGLCTQPGESLVLGAIGAQGYYSELWIHDLHGLVNREERSSIAGPLRRSPGHDFVLPMDHFDHRHPTYQMALLAPADDPQSALPLSWRDEHGPLRQTADLVVHPLPPAQGFPSHSVLLLLRNRAQQPPGS